MRLGLRACAPVGELAENILDDDDGLLDDVVHLCLDQLEQHVDAALGRALELDGAAADRAHGAADKLDVDLAQARGRAGARGGGSLVVRAWRAESRAGVEQRWVRAHARARSARAPNNECVLELA
eukprot:6175007-Pleurochrysis_carterae.AAC.2